MVLSHCALRLSPPSVQKQASSPATEETRAVKTAVHSTARRFSLLFLFHRHAARPSANHRVHAVCLPIHAPIRHLSTRSIVRANMGSFWIRRVGSPCESRPECKRNVTFQIARWTNLSGRLLLSATLFNHAVKHRLSSFPPNSFIPLSKISASLLPVITPDFGTIELQSKPCDKPADSLTRYRRAAPANSLKD